MEYHFRSGFNLCPDCEEIDRMAQILEDKGHTREYARTMAALDFDDMQTETYVTADHTRDQDCSICRGRFTVREIRYHYHPCE